jgi:hypothetical protein
MKVKVITVATDLKGTKELVNSMKRLGLDYEILGLGETWAGFGMKVIRTVEYLKTLTDYTHFIFVDAYDTVFLKVPEMPNEILFSTEKGCWPDADKAKEYPESNYEWKYLNSGCYSSPIKDFLELVKDYPIDYSDDDQRYFTNIYLKSGKIKLDLRCEYFQSYAFATDGDFRIRSTFENDVYSTEPSIIHFNGKCLEPKIYAMVKYETLKEVQEAWRNEPEVHKDIHETFVHKVNSHTDLNKHRTFVENNVFGFGERSFQWMWKLIIDEMPHDFTFLEIGVFKGQTLSLINLLSKLSGKKDTRYGITPLSTEGGVWESDYEKDIDTIHDTFGLTSDYTILKGLSEDPKIIKQAAKLKLDILYIDGGHDERHITNDIENYAHLVKLGGYMVIDDCCNTFKMPFGYFQGIESVTKVVDKMLPPATQSSEWEFIFSAVHNRVYRKI